MGLATGERLGLDIKRAEQALTGAKAAVLRRHGLTVAQFAALYGLAENPGISGAGLARACLVTPQAIFAVLKTLESRGFVTRSRDDWNRNATTVTLTDAGNDALTAADADASRIEEHIYNALAPDERKELRRLLTLTSSALQDLRSPERGINSADT